MKKHIEKFKVRIDQNLNRIEKSVALSPDLVKVEETILVYKQACASLQKKLSEDLQGYGKGTDGSSVERRLKKTGDFVLGNIFSEVGRNLHKQNPNSCLGNVLTYLGELFPQLANNHVNYEICVEQMIISKLQDVLNTDLPKIKSSRGHLDKLLLELDTTKARLEKAREEEQQHAGPAQAHKIERLNEELDDILRNVDQARDGLAADMLSFLSRDNEIAGLLSGYIDYRIQLLRDNYERLEESKPRLESLRSLRKGFPVFGTSLQDHIRDLGMESGIAFPIQLCCTKLMDMGLDEEGLFRLTAGASKVKRLRAEVEAGHAFLHTLDGYDHHVFTGLLKTYLRELPSPLLGEDLYSDWLEAGSLTGEDRFNAIWNLLQSDHLPRENYKNIHYLFKFLNEVTQHSDKNKMTANNLAIVITPNVIWSNTAVQDALDVGAGGVLQQVVELIICQHSWFFQNDPPVVWSQGLVPLKTCLPIGAVSEDTQRSLLGGASLAAAERGSDATTTQTLNREKSRKMKPKPALPPSYSPNGSVTIAGPHSPPASPQVQYRHHSSPGTPRNSDTFKAAAGATGIQHPSFPPPKPPSSGSRISLDVGGHHQYRAASGSTPTRARAMTESKVTVGGPDKAGVFNQASPSSNSPEKLIAQQSKDLLSIGARLVSSDIGMDGGGGGGGGASDQSSPSHTLNSSTQELLQISTPKQPEYSSNEDKPNQVSAELTNIGKKEGFPVPAPRSIKPAVPTKPEGLVKADAVGGVKTNGLYPSIRDVEHQLTSADVKDTTTKL